MIDVWIPAVDQRRLILRRYTQPVPNTKLLIEKLKLQLPSQPPSRLIGQKQSYEIEVPTVGQQAICGADLLIARLIQKHLTGSDGLNHHPEREIESC
jgi:hypothetical protein